MNYFDSQSSINSVSTQFQNINIYQNIKGVLKTKDIQKVTQKKPMLKKINLTQRNMNLKKRVFTQRTFVKPQKSLMERQNTQNSVKIPKLSTRTQLQTQCQLIFKKNSIIRSPIEKIKQKLNKILFDGLEVKNMTNNILKSAKQSNSKIKRQYQAMGEQYDLPQIKKVRQKRLIYLKQVRKMQDWMLTGRGLQQEKMQTLQTMKSFKSFKSLKKLTLASSRKLLKYQF